MPPAPPQASSIWATPKPVFTSPLQTASRLLVVLDVPTCQKADCDPLMLAAEVVAAGARFIWYRNHSAEPDVASKHIASLRHLARDTEATVVFGSTQIGLLEATDNVHETSWMLAPSSRSGIRGRSCHSLEEVAAAEAAGCGYVTLSPIWTPTSHKAKARPPLGIEKLAEICTASTLPVYALGGAQNERVRACLTAGAHGVAVLGAICLSKHPARVVNDLLDAIDGCSSNR